MIEYENVKITNLKELLLEEAHVLTEHSPNALLQSEVRLKVWYFLPFVLLENTRLYYLMRWRVIRQ